MPRSFKFIKNILIRNLQEGDQEMIVLIKKETGLNQASKALLTIGHAYLRLLDANQRDKQKIKALEDENEKMRLLSCNILQSISGLQEIVDNNAG